MVRVLAAVVVLGACGGACGGDAAVPAPCRAPLVATLDDAPLAFDHVFGYRKGEATGVAWFAGEVLGDGQARPRPPSCAEAARGGVGAAVIRIEAQPGLVIASYDLPQVGAAGLKTAIDGQRPCDAAAPCLRARLTSGPAPRPGRLSRCVDLTLRLDDGQGGLHALRMVGRFDAEDCERR